MIVRSFKRPARFAVALVAIVSCMSHCSQKAPPGSGPVPTAVRVDAVPNSPVSGTLNGHSFAARTARYYVDRRPGYEHLDIQLDEPESADPCTPLAPPDGARVWLRWAAHGLPPPAEIKLDSTETASWSAHFQIKDDDRWIGAGQSSGSLVTRRIGLDGAIRGALSACFADGHGSCVAGTFIARECPIGIDMPVRGAAAPGERPSP